jgi:hypothetical protein
MKTRHGATTRVVVALVVLAVGCQRADKSKERAVKAVDDRPVKPTEDEAVKAIQKLGGHFTRNDKAKDKPIVGLDLEFTKVTDMGLKDLAPLKQLQRLDLRSTKVTGAGLKALAPLKQLQELALGSTKVTDAGLKALAPSSSSSRCASPAPR